MYLHHVRVVALQDRAFAKLKTRQQARTTARAIT